MILIKDLFILQSEIWRKGFNFSKFANKIGISKSCLNKIFRNKRVTAVVAKKITDELNSSFDNFFLISECSKGQNDTGCAYNVKKENVE